MESGCCIGALLFVLLTGSRGSDGSFTSSSISEHVPKTFCKRCVFTLVTSVFSSTLCDYCKFCWGRTVRIRVLCRWFCLSCMGMNIQFVSISLPIPVCVCVGSPPHSWWLTCIYMEKHVYSILAKKDCVHVYVHTEDQSAETVMQLMDQQYAPLHLVSMVSKHGTPQQHSNAKDSDLLTKERLCRALSMFEVVLKRLRDILMKDSEVRGLGWCLARPPASLCQLYRVSPMLRVVLANFLLIGIMKSTNYLGILISFKTSHIS